ncbi:MAG: hypothetical protein Q7T26_02155 [Dehalococcoidia bacterium]|nr:hypothetical protein [Dehalococcoidia bacterium]
MTEEVVSSVSNVIVALASVLVAAAALCGLFTWRRELTGKARFEVARKVALLSYEISDAFKWARFPIASSAEAAARPRKEDESPDEAQMLDEWFLRSNRIEALREDLVRLQAAGWEAEVILGNTAGQVISESIAAFRKYFGELASSLNSLFEVRLQQARGQAGNVDTDWIKGLRNTVYSAEGDDLSRHVETANNNLLSSLRTYMR